MSSPSSLLEMDSPAVVSMYTRLAGPHTSGQSPVSISHLNTAVLVLQACAVPFYLIWGLGNQTQFLRLAWQTLYLSCCLPSSSKTLRKLNHIIQTHYFGASKLKAVCFGKWSPWVNRSLLDLVWTSQVPWCFFTFPCMMIQTEVVTWIQACDSLFLISRTSVSRSPVLCDGLLRVSLWCWQDFFFLKSFHVHLCLLLGRTQSLP